jgi:hypothetical protein
MEGSQSMSLDKTAIKNERPAVMATPKVRPPGDGDIEEATADAKEAVPTKSR